MSKSQRDAQRDKVAWEQVELPCSTLDWRVDFRHAPARLRIDANMLGLALGYAAVCLLSRLSFAEGATQAAFGVRLAVRGYRNATSTHETISSSIEPPLLLSGANY